jgi:hypothetical protein
VPLPPKQTISRSLNLPSGYQGWGWYRPGYNPNGVVLNDHGALLDDLAARKDSEAYLYTHHEVFLQNGFIKHTRSSPNWEGGVVTYATCKHRLRSATRDTWIGTWLCGLCPKSCENNCVLFAGRVAMEFQDNVALHDYLRRNHQVAWQAKLADRNPRGDLYTPTAAGRVGSLLRSHRGYVAPAEHTRSVEFYKRSPGSRSTRKDGLIPKWWRDVEYTTAAGRRPRVFVLNPCYLFNKPLLWTKRTPGRAAVRLSCKDLAALLSITMPKVPHGKRKKGGG